MTKATTGVYFRREDYASFWVRVLVDVIDFFILGAFCVGLAIIMLMILPPDRSTVYLILLAFSAAGNLYFVFLKHSRRTLGYRVGRVKIVGLDGNPPSYNSLVWRWLFGLLGPLNWLDSIWLINDKHRQALRDKFAGTYVVKADARPAGEGEIVFRLYYEISLYNFIFREVQVEAPHASK